ncbi:unnamed protein product [Clavelina lepadiformis]|uniref:Protein kinase domain-containing protein n=1 Tax=Clavelina lepadiformis TaxID=159417 RepID=A0ABP0FEV7_CLALP
MIADPSTFSFGCATKGPIENFYEFLEEIGRGASSIVRHAIKKGTKEQFAVKIIEKSEQNKVIQREIGILLTLSHPNIVKLRDIFEDEGYIYLVLEFVSGGELFDRIVKCGYYCERHAARAIRDILEAVVYLHSKNVVHRDLKPENLLYSDDSETSTLKVADFGLSKVNEKGAMKTICGTPGYAAPEVLLGKKYSTSVDIWAIGVIAYILLCGFEPFYDENGDQAMYRKILRGEYDFASPFWDHISDNAKDLVRKMLVLDPAKRLTAKQALNHPWITGKAANFVHMDKTVEKMKAFNARRKLKAIIQAVSASTAMGTEVLSSRTP